MDHYLDLTLLPDPEFSPQQLLEALYAKLHRGLVAVTPGGVGVSFPALQLARGQQSYRLGSQLRLHGSAPALEALMQTPWLTGMRDHVTVSPISPVPAQAQHRNFRRVQADSNPQRLRRRLMRRHHLDEASAQERIPDTAAQRLDWPSLCLRSSSTGQRFLLFIAPGPVSPEPVQGTYSAYGLSATGTVPWF